MHRWCVVSVLTAGVYLAAPAAAQRPKGGPALTEPAAGAVFALYLLLTTQGRDFSFDEVCWWMRDAGFRDIEERALPNPPFTSSMVIAHKL